MVRRVRPGLWNPIHSYCQYLEKNPELLKLAIEGLASSVEGVDKSHPQLVQIANSICNTLSNLRI
jgi:hypothetical protein